MKEELRALLAGLEPKKKAALDCLAEVRQENLEQLFERFGTGIGRVPMGMCRRTKELVRQGAIRASGIEDDLPYVLLSSGRKFFGHLSRGNHRKEHEFIKDLVPALTADTYLLAKDIHFRYGKALTMLPEILPPRGGTVVEVGAFLGHMSVSFVDHILGPEGHLLAIEMMPDNVEILRRNVAANGLQDIIEPLHCGAFSRSEMRRVRGKGRQRNSIVAMDRLPEELDIEVRTERLDVLLRRWDHPRIDLLVITVNGAELHVLEGLGEARRQVRAIFIAAHFTVDGEATDRRCRERLQTWGWRLLGDPSSSRIYALNPTWTA